MAKDKPEKPVKEKSSKKEKKISNDKVTKAKKEKKDKKTRKPIVTPQESNEDLKVSKAVPATLEEQDLSDTKMATKTEEEQMKTDVIKSKITSSRVSEESSSSASSSEEEDAPAMKAPKTTVNIEPNSLFTIDINPTPINRKGASQSESSSESSSSDEAERKESSATTIRTSGNEDVPLNRAHRRRLQLIGRQREVIRKSLNITPGSNEKAEELEASLAEWTAKLDSKAAIRAEKKAKRKEKDALKLRNKRGKVLKGRRLKERTKEINKLEKKAIKKGIKKA